MADDWGCGSSVFGESDFDSSKTLSELVEGLSARKEATTENFPLSPSQAVNVQVVPCILKNKRSAPKILKKKSSINKDRQEPSLKRVTFEVEKFLSAGSVGCSKDEARDRLVVSLGGLPQKGKACNYKVLKEEKAAKKEQTDDRHLAVSVSSRVIKKK